jgi:predicted nucleic acid-binding protein
MLVDAGPLVALLDRRDPDHDECRQAIAHPTDHLHTTWPALAEAGNLLQRRVGQRAVNDLMGLLEQGMLGIVDLPGTSIATMAALMRTYADAPMSIADASLVTAAESTGETRIFTLDAHFHAYRLSGGRTFTVLP